MLQKYIVKQNLQIKQNFTNKFLSQENIIKNCGLNKDIKIATPNQKHIVKIVPLKNTFSKRQYCDISL